MKKILFSLLLFYACTIYAQNPSITLETPSNVNASVTSAKQFITGTTCTECILSVNGNPVKVYKTGVFVYTANLSIGNNTFIIKSEKGKKSVTKTVNYQYQLPKPVKETDSFVIESISIEPNGDAALMAGEYLAIKVKAKPGCKLLMNNQYNLTELPKTQTKGVAGYYQLNYKLKESDSFLLSKFKFELYKDGKLRDTKVDKNTFTIFKEDEPMIGKVKTANTAVYSGLGEDRLGGTKAGFLDSSVLVQIIGRFNNLFKVRLNNSLSVYIPKENIEILPSGNLIPKSLSGNVGVTGDSLYDYLRIDFTTKLPYLSTQNVNPNQIIVDVYGATVNSNWVIQYPETLQEITEVDVNQVQDGQLRLTIDLNSKQLWGYKMYYEGNSLVVKVRRPKSDLRLSNMVIGIDAGHGGSNDGAKGIAGRYEKEFTLLIAKEIRDLLQKEGAKVIMTRETEMSYENQERLKMYRQKMPDFVLSIHLNSAGDPLRVKGASTYYKYNAFKGLSYQIYKRIKETGLNGWGNIGNFNFFLNSATEFPSALVECLFISNPEDEEKVHDAGFRTILCQKIVAGVQDWLLQCAANK